MPTPEWIKELLAEAARPPPAMPVSVPEPANEPVPETDIPADVQEEIRATAAAEAALVGVLEPEIEYVDVVETETEDVELEEGAVPEEVEAEEDEQEPPEPPKEPRPPRRFEFRVNAAPLKAFVALLEPLADEVKVTANGDAWHVLAVDPAHVAMVDLTLTDLPYAFERRAGVLERITDDAVFGLDLTKMKEILRLLKKDDAVSFIMDLPDAEDKDRITVEIGRTKRTMNAIDTADLADPKVPALNLPAKLTVAMKDLLEAVKAAESVSDHIRLTATREGLNVTAEGDVDKVSLDLEASVDYVQGEEGKASSLFPLDYLAAFVKAVRDAKVEELVVQLGTDYPIRVDWDGAVKGTYLCAPRIETP